MAFLTKLWLWFRSLSNPPEEVNYKQNSENHPSLPFSTKEDICCFDVQRNHKLLHQTIGIWGAMCNKWATRHPLLSCLPAAWLYTCIPVYLHTCIPACIHAYKHTWIHDANIHAYAISSLDKVTPASESPHGNLINDNFHNILTKYVTNNKIHVQKLHVLGYL